MSKTTEFLDELCERSKDDREIIVGSEIRQIIALARHAVELERAHYMDLHLCMGAFGTFMYSEEMAKAVLAYQTTVGGMVMESPEAGSSDKSEEEA